MLVKFSSDIQQPSDPSYSRERSLKIPVKKSTVPIATLSLYVAPNRNEYDEGLHNGEIRTELQARDSQRKHVIIHINCVIIIARSSVLIISRKV